MSLLAYCLNIYASTPGVFSQLIIIFVKKGCPVTEAKVEVYYSLQSDYCYFLLDRLLQLSQKQVAIVIQPILGGVLRLPERFKDRDELEQNYFLTDAARTADFLDLPYATPNPSPMTFKPGSFWVTEDEQPRVEYLYHLFVSST